MDPRNQRMQATARSGFSLIEIMVVMIILLIGIFAVVRLFPQGFAAIARTGDMGIATAEAQQQIDTQKNQLALPDAIVAINPLTGLIDPTVLPTDITDFTPGDASLGGKDPYFWSNINRIRRIMGETFRIPGPATNSLGVSGAVYALQLGPVENVLTAGAPNTDSLTVKGAALERTEQSSVPTFAQPDPTPALRNEAQYAIDYSNFMIAFQPRIKAGRAFPFRQFILSFDYYANVGGAIALQYQQANPLNTVITVPDVDMPAPGYGPPKPVWQHIFVNAGDPPGYIGMAVVPPGFILNPNFGFNHGSEDVSRQFRLVNATTVEGGGGQPAWSSGEPYEYAWFSKQDPTNTVNPGVLIFNPSGHDQIQDTSSGSQPIMARVDYSTYDNHILRDDRTVPTQAPYSIQLSAPFLQMTGDVLDNQIPYNNFNAALNPYNGIFRTAGTATPDVLIYDLNTGQQVGDWTNGVGSGILAAGPKNPLPVGQQSGVLTLNPDNVAAANPPLQGASLRIFYRGSKDWGVQVQKATAHYIESPTPAALQFNFNNYYVGGTIPGTGVVTRIYFPRCDTGKTVVLGVYYAIVQGNPNPQAFRNEAYQLTSDPSQFDVLNLPYIDVISVHGNITSFTAVPTGRTVDNVQGVSLKAKVLWRNSNLRFRHVETDTLINQQPGL